MGQLVCFAISCVAKVRNKSEFSILLKIFPFRMLMEAFDQHFWIPANRIRWTVADQGERIKEIR